MPRRSLTYRSLKALEDERKLGELDALLKSADYSYMDPTSEIPGTGPEKQIYNYLLRLGIRFDFQYHTFDLGSTAFPEDIWVPDFLLNDYNYVIEVFGSYWHSLPARRTADIMKLAYWLIKGYAVYEYGIPTYPDVGPSNGKVFYWWDWEIAMNLTQLFNRDIPELFTTPRAEGQPGEYLLDRRQQFERQRGLKARGVKARARPQMSPIEKQIRTLRNKMFNINKINPIYKQDQKIAWPKIPKKYGR